MAEMGCALRQDFQALIDQHTRGWFEPENGLEESLQVVSTLAVEMQNLLQISNDLIRLQRWLTSGFAPIEPTPVREVDLGQSAEAISLNDFRDLAEREFVQNDSDLGLPGGLPLNSPILGFDVSGSVESHRRDAQPNVDFESDSPQAWETSTLVPPQLGGLGGQVPKPQRIEASTFTEQPTPRVASPEIHTSVVQPSQQSEQSSTNVKQVITREISQPDGLAGSPLFQKQPRSIGGLRDLVQFLAVEQQPEEAIEAVENSQDSIRAAINPIPTNSPPSILPDDWPTNPETSGVIWHLEEDAFPPDEQILKGSPPFSATHYQYPPGMLSEPSLASASTVLANAIADKLPPQNLTSKVMAGSTELQALVRLAEMEGLQRSNDVSDREESISRSQIYSTNAVVSTNRVEPNTLKPPLQHQSSPYSGEENFKPRPIRTQNGWVEAPATLSRTLGEADLDVIVDAIAQQIQQEYRQFYGG